MADIEALRERFVGLEGSDNEKEAAYMIDFLNEDMLYFGNISGSATIEGMYNAVHEKQKTFSKKSKCAETFGPYIEEYAESRHMSISWFIRSFKHYCKMTPLNYIVSIRISNAKTLLENTSYNITEIAAIVGYDNPLYFSALFKKNTGMSPTEFRKTYKRELQMDYTGLDLPMYVKKNGED